MSPISDDLRKQAEDAFRAYEEVFVKRIAREPRGHLDARQLLQILETGDEQVVRRFFEDHRRARQVLLNSTVV